MAAEKDESIYVLMLGQPETAKAVPHRTIRPMYDASGKPVRLAVSVKSILFQIDDPTFHSATGTSVCFEPFDRIVGKLWEPAFGGFADLGADDDSFGRDIDIAPNHQSQF